MTRSSIPLVELAAAIGGEVEGDPDLPVSDVTNVEDAVPGALVRVEHRRFLEAAESGPGAALLVDANLGPVSKPCVRVGKVRLAFLHCLELFSRERLPPLGIHPTATVAPSAEIAGSCSVGAYAVIGENTRVGEGTAIYPHAVIGDDVEIGAGCVLFPQVTLYSRTVLGARVRIHAGAVIGSDGYGYEWDGRQHAKIPHNGRVRIGDDVEIGANTAIDRGTTGETVIGPGTKIDNLVHIAHNVKTGAHCLILAQVGVAGSTTLGNGVILAGQAGVSDHVTLGDGVRAGAQSGIFQDQPSNASVSGSYSRPHREHLRVHAAVTRLPELLRRVAELEARVRELEPESES